MSDLPTACAKGHKGFDPTCLDCFELAAKHDAANKAAQRQAYDAEQRLGAPKNAVVDKAIQATVTALHVAERSLVEAHKELMSEKPDAAVVHQHVESAKMAAEIAQTIDRLADKVMAR